MLIYTTTNEGKLAGMRKMLKGLPLIIKGLHEMHYDGVLPEVDENGTDPLANAIIKAQVYYSLLKQPLFSLDSGLYFEGLPPEEQPGTHVRNIKGCRLTDDEMITHYAGIAHAMGGRIKARYINGICLILSKNEIHTHTGEDISYEPFYIVDKPHSVRKPGFPLDSISVHIASNQYYYDRPETDELSIKTEKGFVNFFEAVLNG